MRKIWSGNAPTSDDTLEPIYGLNARNIVRSQEVIVGATQVKVPATPIIYRMNMLIKNVSTNIIYIGGDGVLTTSGYPLYPMGELRIDAEDKVDVYAITTIAGQALRVIEGA